MRTRRWNAAIVIAVLALAIAAWLAIGVDVDGAITGPTPTPIPFPTGSPTPTSGGITPPPGTATPPPQLLRWGDVNCDGTVNSVDALATLRWKAGLPVIQVTPCPAIGVELGGH
jgi:hypothetical protein